MKTHRLYAIVALALGSAIIAATTVPSHADRRPGYGPHTQRITAHAGTTFTPLEVVEVNEEHVPIKFRHLVDGVARVSLLGNCTVHFDVIAVPRPDGTFSVDGTLQITTAGGQTTLNADVAGSTSAEPDNGLMANFHYDVTFTGGTGPMADVRGTAEIDGMLLFNEGFAGGKATWAMDGKIFRNRPGMRN